jgi:hypothetical protein
MDGGPGDPLRLYLEGEFRLVQAGREATFGTTEQTPSDYAPLLGLMGERASRALVSSDGDLLVEFANGSKIRASPDPDYEGWNLTLGDLMVVCVPGGGEPAIFDG